MKILDSSDLKAWDNFTIKNEPISSVALMERAATNCTKQILGSFSFETVDIICGVGNNGGDGLVVARLLNDFGKKVNLYISELSENFSPDFNLNFKKIPKTIDVVRLTEKNHSINLDSDLIIDAIFGSGLNRPIEGWLLEIISSVNKSDSPVVSIDMPSGLFATKNTENNLKNIINSDLTLTFQTPKLSFFFSEHHAALGQFKILDIGLSPSFKIESSYNYISKFDIRLKKRNLYAHKGSHGFLTVIGGIDNMFGAAIMTSLAAFRTGSGYVATKCSSEGLNALMSLLPESIWIDENKLEIPQKTTAIAIGPGLGLKERSIALLKLALKSNLPLVIDADAITIIAKDKILLNKIPKNSILTPHQAELKRLIGRTNSDEELLQEQIKFSIKHQIYILQKGAFSKLSTPDGTVFINSTGNPGMASAGMGDALTGIIGSFLAQGYNSEDAAIYGMYIHGAAGDKVVEMKGIRGMITSDLINALPEVLNSFD